jgi:hypothetical protein
MGRCPWKLQEITFVVDCYVKEHKNAIENAKYSLSMAKCKCIYNPYGYC